MDVTSVANMKLDVRASTAETNSPHPGIASPNVSENANPQIQSVSHDSNPPLDHNEGIGKIQTLKLKMVQLHPRISILRNNPLTDAAREELENNQAIKRQILPENMENHQFELIDQAHAYSMFRPTPPQELVEIIINYLSKELPSPYASAVDVGCGSGQSTIILSPHFQSVLGCDVSKAQIKEAINERQLCNVKYKISPAESLPVPDQSVQLLTAATCFHWLNKETFFKEAKRVLTPGGVLAVYSSCAIYPFTENVDRNTILRQLTDQILYEDLKMYRSSCVQQLFEKYKNVYFPFHDVTRIRDISHSYVATAADAAGYIRSMSTFQNFQQVYPQKAEHLLVEYQNRIMEVLGKKSRPETTPLRYERNYFLVMCRKTAETRNEQ